MPRLNRTNLRFCKSYCCTVLFSLFNTVPNILSLVKSGFLPVSVCFFQNSDLRNENSELSPEPQMRGQILTRIEARTVPGVRHSESVRFSLKLSSESQVFRQSIRFVSELVRIPYIDSQSNSCMKSQQNATRQPLLVALIRLRAVL